ncbi:MAG: hypothetical protein ACRDMZ_07855, partial [Solirubrobacteraceae bacterium]
DRTNEANSLLGLGRVALQRREAARAYQHLTRAAAIYRQLGQVDADRRTLELLEQVDELGAGEP